MSPMRAGQRQGHSRRIAADGLNLRRHAHADGGIVIYLLPQGLAQHPIGHHEAKGLDALFAGRKPCEGQPARIGDMNGADHPAVGGNGAPDTEGIENAAAGIAQRGGALIEALMGSGFRADALDEYHRAAGGRQRQSKAGADHATADDGDVERFHYAAAITASMASGFLGAPAVSTSAPSRVTSTSSSMRMPILSK